MEYNKFKYHKLCLLSKPEIKESVLTGGARVANKQLSVYHGKLNKKAFGSLFSHSLLTRNCRPRKSLMH